MNILCEAFDKDNRHVYEWCPYCEQEVKLDAVLKKQICPDCGKIIYPCALCDCDVVDCNKCPIENN